MKNTLAMRMKMTNLGFPSSSILGKGGGGVRWYWRAIIPFFPFASTTNTCRCRRWGWTVQLFLRLENRECLAGASSWSLELERGRRTSAFRDIVTSISDYTLSFSFSYPYHFFFLLYNRNWFEDTGHTRGR